MTVEDVLNYNRVAKTIIDNMRDVKATIRFRLLQMTHQFESVVNDFEKIREEKLKQYGKTNEDGEFGIFIPNKEKYTNEDDYQNAMNEYEECITNFKKDLDEVLNTEAKIEITKFKADEIMDAGIPADFLLAIYDLIEE